MSAEVPCLWTIPEKYKGYDFETLCGHGIDAESFNNDWRYCPYCGKEIRVVDDKESAP